jgi:hypothetical protein
MAVRKKDKQTYEYFKIDEMFFVGKHREYVDQLWTQNKIQESYFKRLVDLYAVAAIIGLRIGRKSPEVSDGTDLKRTVQLKQLSDNYQTLMPIMRMILLFDDSRELTLEQKLESAFTIPEDEELYRSNMELFNSYARGGVEYLYEQLILRESDVDDVYSDARVSNIVALLHVQLAKDAIL